MNKRETVILNFFSHFCNLLEISEGNNSDGRNFLQAYFGIENEDGVDEEIKNLLTEIYISFSYLNLIEKYITEEFVPLLKKIIYDKKRLKVDINFKSWAFPYTLDVKPVIEVDVQQMRKLFGCMAENEFVIFNKYCKENFTSGKSFISLYNPYWRMWGDIETWKVYQIAPIIWAVTSDEILAQKEVLFKRQEEYFYSNFHEGITSKEDFEKIEKLDNLIKKHQINS